MARETQPTPIFLAWERAHFGNPIARESQADWARLWAQHTQGERFVGCTVDDAILLGVWGWGLAARERDWQAALDRVSRCTRHPEWAAADRNSSEYVLSRIAAGHLLLGERAAAIAGYRELLAMRRPYHGTPAYLVRNDLLEFCEEQDREQGVPRDLASLVVDVIREIPGRKRLASKVRPESATFGELAAVLRATFPTKRA